MISSFVISTSSSSLPSPDHRHGVRRHAYRATATRMRSLPLLASGGSGFVRDLPVRQGILDRHSSRHGRHRTAKMGLRIMGLSLPVPATR